MEKRRQNQSCDQCRRSKKACDGYLLNRSQPSPDSGATAHGPAGLLPCSYCAKTKKQCSFNSQWARHTSSPVDHPSTSSSQNPTSHHPHTKRTRSGSHSESVEDVNPASILQFLQTPTSNNNYDWVSPYPEPDVPSISSLEGHLASIFNQESLTAGYNDSFLGLDSAESPTVSHPLETVTLDQFGPSTIQDDIFSQSNAEVQSSIWNSTESPRHLQEPTITVISSPRSSHSSRSRRKLNSDQNDATKSSISPFTIDSEIVAKSNNNLITESLLRIYHDVLENNLACWIAEETCPFTTRQRQRAPFSLTELQRYPSPTAGSNIMSEWGAVWSNRMYRRVKQLDRVSRAAKVVHVTPSESRAVSKALDLAIAAFATQWTQNDRRRRQSTQRRQEDSDDDEQSDEDDFENSFERNLQYSIWEQARSALKGVAEVECFRVVYAELVFGMIQKPWDDVEASESTFNDKVDELKSTLNTILAGDGPPVFLERAARKIHALKFRFEAAQLGSRPPGPGCSEKQHAAALNQITSEHRGTVGLLFWLATMLDTVSSSVNHRPCVISDEDSQHEEDHEAAMKQGRTVILRNSRRWKLGLFAQDDIEKPSTLHWPCAYDVATQAIARSAGVKVLLFRYVSYFQTAIRKKESPQAIEDVISSTTSIYRYWNTTHGVFFRDLTKNYDSLPTRIKSWFPCIDIPWHLGSLMVADLLEFVDDNNLGFEDRRTARKTAKVASAIRRATCIELADLARATQPGRLRGSEPEQLANLHFAMNESALLAEPWTMLLVRAFARAAIFHMDTAVSVREEELAALGHETGELEVWVKRCESCIESLWFLGRKSGMARSLAKVLTQALKTQTSTDEPDQEPRFSHEELGAVLSC
ncbi:unnamed protein product [Clonostachys byssicola]|uniref:Zn(2)-C6 fungal-type domain-containing protein n=1 Tax=Clonostachys byssicola TaxID=160290 RepID=A0A9N9UUM4_9HYPO|nr:unnamed protein product [Clonostachys byssicola]